MIGHLKDLHKVLGTKPLMTKTVLGDGDDGYKESNGAPSRDALNWMIARNLLPQSCLGD